MDWFWLLGPIFLFVWIVYMGLTADRHYKELRARREKAHEKVQELTEKGHKAEICPTCEGKGMTGSIVQNECPKCFGIGYLYELNSAKED